MKIFCAAALLILSLTSTAGAQSLVIADSAGKPKWRAAPGEKLTITASGLKCDAGNKEPLITLGEEAVPVETVRAPDSWVVTVPVTVDADAYQLTVTCGAAKPSSWLTVIPAAATVVCARNPAPKPTEEQPSGDKCTSGSIWEVREHDRIDVEVYQLEELRKGTGNKPLRLFIGGIELKNLDMRLSKYSADTGRSLLWTRLDFDNDDANNRKSWVQLMQLARNKKRVDVSIGPEGGPQFVSTAVANFNVYSTGWTIFTVSVIGLLLVAIALLAGKSSLLRGPKCADGPAPFSLARHQMAAWFIVVVSAYLFLMLMTGRAATSPTALILIGISGATGLAAVIIDAQQADQTTRDREVLLAEQKSLNDALDNPESGLRAQLAKVQPGSTEAAQLTANIQTKTQRLAEITTLLQQKPSQRSPSLGWYRDLLSDENGISLHRLQIVVWTVVLVGVFARAVWRDLIMPDFDATTLALMGVSSGTYLGFKLPK